MNFAELYRNNKQAVEEALSSMWCGETNNDSQKAYVEQLKGIIKNLFAPDNAMPLVQCMNSYKSVFTVDAEEAKAIVGSLWTAPYAPYEHQYQCWNTLLKEKCADGKPMSICVTTGTGSGKTECFMMPLVHDLIERNREGEIQALFLYPLNALMEDQKERLEALLTGTNLTYAVYNGDLPEKEPSDDDHSKDANKLRHRIAQIRGEYIDDKTGETKYKFPKLLYTREMVRKQRPNILLTNPTMLEYILLRGSDSKLINPALQSLKWIAIDETHTYTGAGAAELAMLLRRVMLAFNVDPEDVRFATSSATFSNSEPGTAQAKEDEHKLQEFISGITGVRVDQVKVVQGERLGEKELPSANLGNEDKERWNLILKADYIELDKLFPGASSIEEKLQMFDDMCSRAEALNPLLMKAKVHYFYRVPNNGLYVRLDEHKDGAFRIYDYNVNDEEDTCREPLLELCRCKHCGEYVAVALQNTTSGEYSPFMVDDSDMFDLNEEIADDSDVKFSILGLSNTDNLEGDNNAQYTLKDGKLTPASPGDFSVGEWHIVGNTQYCCPYCNSKLSNKKAADEDELINDMEEARLVKFRLSADFISRVIASPTLDQLDKYAGGDKELILHDGQQYISFVDSRQAAAKTTLKQNLEQERMWFYTTIYHELCRRRYEVDKVQAEIGKRAAEIAQAEVASDEWIKLSMEIKELRAKLRNYITWKEIAKLLEENEYCTTFAQLFVNRSSDSDEMEDNGNIKSFVIKQYVQSIMVEYLSRRPVAAMAPETMGLFHPYYEEIESITETPQAVTEFNNIISKACNKIELQDWKNLLQIFIDYTVRSYQSVFLKLEDVKRIDIHSSVRFATTKAPRHPAKKPSVEDGPTSRIVQCLAALIARDNANRNVADVIKTYKNELQDVIDAMWQHLIDIKMLEHSEAWDEEANGGDGEFVKDKGEPMRLNLARMCFRLYDKVYLCDTNGDSDGRQICTLRTVQTTFKNFSPYMKPFKPVELKEDLFEEWTTYPYYNTSGYVVNADTLANWACENRKLLWNNSLWGETGVFADRLNEIHLTPQLFTQAEHTAQVDKVVSRQIQHDFKNHRINILACSTTMEMGVDLGNLEVVMLQSVPPQPSNYKQRAGRSGRNNKVRSACITLCSSDAIGLRTLYNPLETIINRPVAVPMIDLMSPQVVQRHVNSFLVRYFGVFNQGTHGGSLNQKVVDFFTPFKIVCIGGRLKISTTDDKPVDPTMMLGCVENTLYSTFQKECEKPLSPELQASLAKLLSNTVFAGECEKVIERAKLENKRCYDELEKKVADIKFAFEDKTRTFKSEIQKRKFHTKLELQFLELLNQRLLTFWSTSRFTPNANMPVNVLSFDINTTSGKSFYAVTTSSNPSYSLREAIAQYVPGNSIVVDGVVFTVRGIEYTNFYQGINNFKKIYRNVDKTVIGDEEGLLLSSKIPWNVTGREDVELVQPVGFVPDVNERVSRVMDNNKFTRVSAQLIDTEDWNSVVTEEEVYLLYSVRNNKDTGNAKILYYNEGIGYGYCLCPMCGKMVLEEEVASDETILLPFEMNDRYPKDKTKPKYHLAINGRESRKYCSNSDNVSRFKRNIIIGDMIQTDFSEIRIRHKGMDRWISNRDDKLNLLYTLGVVFTQSLADVLGKEKGAIDFTIMPNGHICIFDTNPGGAGYSNQMKTPDIMAAVLSTSKELLLRAKDKKSKDFLLDKYTLRYIKYIDIEAALCWFEEML